MNNMKKSTMTVTEMAQQLGISRPIAYELAKRKDFPALRIGRRILIPRAAFELWLMEASFDRTDHL